MPFSARSGCNSPSWNISRTLASLEGVVSARVHLVASPSGPPSALRAPIKPRASVLLKVRNGQLQAVAARKAEIQSLVAGSVEGLDAELVAVMLSELPVPPAVAVAQPSAAPSHLPVAIAASLVAVLSGALAFAFLHARRLRQRLLEAAAPADAPTPAPAPTR